MSDLKGGGISSGLEWYAVNSQKQSDFVRRPSPTIRSPRSRSHRIGSGDGIGLSEDEKALYVPFLKLAEWRVKMAEDDLARNNEQQNSFTSKFSRAMTTIFNNFTWD